MKRSYFKLAFLLFFSFWIVFTPACARKYRPKKNQKEQQKIRHKEAKRQDRVINKD
ncbi:MAG: hypothetical protein JXR34_00850 [Bacteroidales bacterium]|nr:hypothetical protein [Bacteroidales bacterium]